MRAFRALLLSCVCVSLDLGGFCSGTRNLGALQLFNNDAGAENAQRRSFIIDSGVLQPQDAQRDPPDGAGHHLVQANPAPRPPDRAFGPW